jgi:ribosomal protein L21E
MADVIRYYRSFKSKVIEIFQREVGKTQRYMYIPTNLITRTEAEKICDIITNGGNIANACVVDVINGGATYYFTWKVTESLKKAEADVYLNVFSYLELQKSKQSASTTTNQSFLYKVDDNFEDTTTGKVWKIVGINVAYDAYEIQKDNATNTLNINRNVFEQEVSSGRLQLIFVNQPAQSVTAITNKQFNDKVLEELQKVEKGDIIKIVRKDGTLYTSIEVIEFTNNGIVEWDIKGLVNNGSDARFYEDYWQEVLKKGDLEVQIIKKPLASIFKVGDKVKIRKDSQYYGKTSANPKGMVGEVIELDRGGLRVEWENKQKNSYENKDLEFATQAQKFKVGDKIKIRKDSKFFGDGARNPKDKIGEITGIDLKDGLNLPIRVTWSDGAKNTYNEDDLEFYQGLNSTLKVVCILNEKQGIIEDLEGQESATGGGRVWNIFFDDNTELLCYRDEFFVEGDVLQLESPSYSPKILVNKISIIRDTVEYYLIEKATGNVGNNIEENTIPDLFTFSIKLVDKVEIGDTLVNETQAKPIVYAVDLIYKQIVKVDNLEQTATLPKNEVWNLLDKKDSPIESYRAGFFVVGDVLEITTKSPNVFTPPEEVLITNIDFENDSIEVKADDFAVATLNISGLFSTYDIKIIEYYNLKELFDQPILIPKPDSATPLTPTSTILSEIEQAKKDLGQLLFMRNLLSPIDFEQKIEVTQLIDQKQKLINDLNFKKIEEKMATDQFFDDLFEQSFVEIKHEYTDIYSGGEELDFFTPNGKRSELSFELNEIIRTPQFKEWFGDWELSYIYKDADALELDCSKVLTPDFEPRVVWHGTGQQFSYFIFDKFPAAYFAVNKEYSQFFADLQGGGDGYVIPFFLNIRNPLDLTHFETKLVTSKDFFDYLYLMTGLTMEQLDVNPIFLSGSTPALETWMYIRNNPKMLKKIADTHIYDGINFYETNPNMPDVTSKAHKTEAYITFSADQCKIAEPNRGMLLFASLKSFLLKRGGKI